MATTTIEYVLRSEHAQQEFDRLIAQQRKVQQGEEQINKTVESNASKRRKLLKEEEQDLKELRQRRDAAYSTKEIELYNKRIRETEKRVKNLKGEYTDLEKRNKGLLTSFRQIGTAIGLAFGVREILNFTKRAAELSAEAEGVRTAFQRVGGTRALLIDLQKATRGTATEIQLMNRAVQATNFKIPLNELSTLLQFATNRAIELGKPVDQFVDRVIDGIGRKSVKVLDDLGLSLAELQEETKQTGDFAKGVSNIIQRELTAMGDVADTNAVKIQRAQAELQNATLAFGDIVAPVYADFLDLLGKAVQGINALATGMSKADQEDYANAQSRVNFEIEEMRKAAIGAAGANDVYVDRLEKVRQELIKRGKADADLQDAFRAILALTIQKREETQKMLETDKLAAMNATQYTRAMIEQIPALKMLIEQIKEGTLAGKDNVDVGRTIADIQEEIKTTQQQMNEEVAAGSSEFFRLEARVFALNKELESYLKRSEDADKRTEELKKALEDVFKEQDEDAKKFAGSVGDAFLEIKKGIFADDGDDTFDLDKTIAEGEAAIDETERQRLERLEQVKDEIDGLFSYISNASAGFLQQGYDFAIAELDRLLEATDITEDEYARLLGSLDEQLTAFRAAQTANTLGAASDLVGAIQGLLSVTSKDAQKNAQFLQNLSTFQILIDQARAVASAIASAAAGSITPIDLAIKVATAVATVATAFAKAKAIQNQARLPAPPTFATGGFIGGRPHSQGGTMIEAEKGEAIIRASQAKKAKDAIDAINAGRFEQYVVNNYLPHLIKSDKRKAKNEQIGLAQNIVNALQMDNELTEKYLKMLVKKSGKVEVTNLKDLRIRKNHWTGGV